MALDPNIILGYRSPQIKSPAEMQEEQFKLSALKNQQAGMERDEAMRQELGSLGDLSDPEKVASVLQKYDPMKAQEYRNSAAKSKNDSRKAKVEEYFKAMEFASNQAQVLSDEYDGLIASGVDDATARAKLQPIHAQTAQRLKQMFPDTQVSEQFDPVATKAMAMQGPKTLEWIKSKIPEYGAPVKTDKGLVQFDKKGNPKPTGYNAPDESKPSSIKEYEYAKAQGYTGTFEQFDKQQRKTSAPSTTVTNSYNPNPLTLGKAGENKVDEDLLGNTSKITRLNDIQRTFKPEFLEVGNRAKMMLNSAKLKMGSKIDPVDEESLSDFSTWKRSSITNLNQTIKDLTGSAMGVQEADRIISSLPNPGTGLTDGDDAVSFQSKLNSAIKEVKNAVARGAYIKRNGLSINDVPLEKMPALMNERAGGIERELVTSNPALAKDKKALVRQVRERLSTEFGLVSE